jgi:hypothetical protein
MSRSFPFLEQELARWPEVRYTVDATRPHHRLWVEVNGRRQFLPFSSTRTNSRGSRNAVAMLRRLLRQMGAQRA